MIQRFYTSVIIYGSLCLIACASLTTQTPSRYQMESIEILVQRFRENPSDHEAIRDIGIHCLNQKRFDIAEKILRKSLTLDPSDAITVYHLGLTLESLSRHEDALNIYRRFDSVSRSGDYRKLMKARYEIVTKEVMRQLARSIISQEDALRMGAITVHANKIAVIPFQYTGTDAQYASLGRGLGEMMITDLSQIESLELVERIRIQSLFDEMKLQQSGLISSDTAPRFGHLFQAGQVLFGVYDVLQDKILDVDLEFFDLSGDKPSIQATADDALDNLFIIEKRIVLSMLVKMGIRLTQEQKEKIMFIPTRNIQAFMAYCKGLEQQDAGQYQAAAASFQSAVQQDPNFSIAETKLEENQTLITASGDTESMLATREPRPEIESPVRTDDLLTARLENLSQNIGAALVPGQDTREAAVEATSSGANTGVGDLPRPPIPPQ